MDFSTPLVAPQAHQRMKLQVSSSVCKCHSNFWNRLLTAIQALAIRCSFPGKYCPIFILYQRAQASCRHSSRLGRLCFIWWRNANVETKELKGLEILLFISSIMLWSSASENIRVQLETEWAVRDQCWPGGWLGSLRTLTRDYARSLVFVIRFLYAKR